MPLFYAHTINTHTRLAIWKIEEDENFFNQTVPVNNTITHPHKRLQHLAGRYLLRYLFPAFPYQAIKIAHTKKPYLPNEDYHFSISHCADYAAAIVSTNQRVGIDIEIVMPRIKTILHKFLSQTELSFIQQNTFSDEELLQQATLVWSIKESLFKWWGKGNVDFKTMLAVALQHLEEQGCLHAQFIDNKETFSLSANYNFFNNLVLSYVIT
jgi:phosphopantetheinyl transferase